MLGKFIESTEVKPILEKYFVVTDLETGNEPVSNPGTAKYIGKFGDKDKSVPLTVITDVNGKMIVNSFVNGSENIGFPSSSEDVGRFMAMLKQGAPAMSDSERGVIEAKLSKSVKK